MLPAQPILNHSGMILPARVLTFPLDTSVYPISVFVLSLSDLSTFCFKPLMGYWIFPGLGSKSLFSSAFPSLVMG